MSNSWETNLASSYDEAFGSSARRDVDQRTQLRHFDYADDIQHHLRLIDQVGRPSSKFLQRWR